MTTDGAAASGAGGPEGAEAVAAGAAASGPGTGSARSHRSGARDALTLVVCSLIGVFMFFVPVTMDGKSSIPLDHLVTLVRTGLGPAVPYVLLAIILFGTVRPFVVGTWNASPTRTVFSFLNIAGLAAAAALTFMPAPPGWLAAEDIGPFLWDSLVTPVGLLIPIGGIFLAFLVSFGLMEFVGVFVRPIMRPVWKTPGRSAVDAVASFVGSYSLGLLITNRVYRSGGYTAKESAIIAVGFSTVSVTFMIVVATATDLMDRWLTYFFVSLVVTFLVTAITVRIPPLSRIPDEYFPGAVPQPEPTITQRRFAAAWEQAREALAELPGIPVVIWQGLRDGFLMVSSILPSIMSVGLGGLLLAKHTPIFDWAGWILFPFTWITGLEDPLGTGKALSLGLVEMFLPAAEIGADGDLATRFTVAVVCVSAIIFFSAMVPSVLATDIPVKLWHMIVIWFERVVLSVLLTAPLAHLIL
ncbi:MULTISPECIES: YjiH family protein [Brevibacterium]|uniref:YjiH family protein n=1 Tax=Brevibacterium salitolerans TaxID=1403566 RepID=A0ABN2WST6_9MICO|nr:YjiH family protein [Brevibacterium sp.]